MMTEWQAEGTRPLIPSYRGMARRGFFVAEAKCQARVLGCQALKLETMVEAIGYRLKGRALAFSLRPLASSCLIWWRKQDA